MKGVPRRGTPVRLRGCPLSTRRSKPGGFPHVSAFESNSQTTARLSLRVPKENLMSEDNTVKAELRESFGKGFARRLRAAGKIPAVICGHGTEPVHVALPGHQVSLIIRRANALLELDIEGTS